MNPMKRGQVRYMVYDREVMKRLVTNLVKCHGQGRVLKAAKALKMTQPTLFRLKHMLSNAVAHATMAALERGASALPKPQRRDLIRSVLSRGGLRLFRRGWTAWCRERGARLVTRRGQTWGHLAGKPPRPISAAGKKRSIAADLDTTLNSARAGCGDLFDRLRAAAVRAGLPDMRHDVAVIRIVEPLAEFGASAFIEPRWAELSEKDRRAFVRHGVAREEIIFKYLRPEFRANLTAEGNYPSPHPSVIIPRR